MRTVYFYTLEQRKDGEKMAIKIWSRIICDLCGDDEDYDVDFGDDAEDVKAMAENDDWHIQNDNGLPIELCPKCVGKNK